MEKKRNKYENILNQVSVFKRDEDKKEQTFLLKLFCDLAIIYFHWNISFSLLDISFKKENNFKSEKWMIS